MSRISRKIRNGILSMAMAGTLGLGAMQVFATPAQAEVAACVQPACNAACEAQWGPFAAGYCENGQCMCAV
ncbi:MAG TPA: hypothetical protein VK399_02290 [Longimicrobiaceae bacterium]|jgi:hypothetical protein|nr:hypothetical protein [Longimicrobiaceae bacterium]